MDTGVSSASAGVVFTWVQPMPIAQYTAYTKFQFYIKCVSTLCTGITFQFDLCTSSITLNLTSGAWTPVVVTISSLTGCTSLQRPRWDFPGNRQFMLDSIQFICGTGSCPNPRASTPTGPPTLSPPPGTPGGPGGPPAGGPAPLSGGAIAGIVIGVIAGVLIVGAIIALVLWKFKGPGAGDRA